MNFNSPLVPVNIFAVAVYTMAAAACFADDASISDSDGKKVTDGKQITKPAEAKPPEPRFKIYGWLEGGLTGNVDAPVDNHNFGQLYTDRANEFLLNQASIVGERALDPTVTGFDWGFKIWFLYGSDTRYGKSLGIFDLATNDRVQPDFPEVYFSLHIPIPATSGLDLKIGKYQDPMSAESYDPRSNIFYSHSYIYQFGVPGNNTGGIATLHVNKYLDIYAGVNRGVNTSLDDNNQSVAFEGGLGLNLLDGNLTTLALTHIGPETPHNNHSYRYLNDITTTWKVTKTFTSITDLNLIYDDGANAYGYGFAQYFQYAFNDLLSAAVRTEVWRDEEGFYVAQFRANNDAAHILRGDNIPFDPSNLGGGKTTYFAVTAGVNIKPPMPKPIAGLVFRPEIRYDRALTNTRPFKQNSSEDQLTIGFDIILSF
ncbi:MAG: outer membrane beta-barrel protein [Verrucomicrobia bacterium]|nr:outer membrane beta-barrel protein [Verrucomicrobiota bacterium]